MLVAAVQHDIAWEDKPANHDRVESLLAAAALPVGSFAVLPELGDTGFSFALDRIVDEATLPWAVRTARRFGIWLQFGWAERGDDGKGRNCTAIVRPDGTVACTYRKIHPFSFGREIEHYVGGDAIVGTIVGETSVCPFVCYDLRFPEIFRHAARDGAELFTVIASWPAARREHWRTLLLARAIENQAFVVGVNRVGRDPHLDYAGGSIVVGPLGEILAEADDREQVLVAEVDPGAARAWRTRFPALSDLRDAWLPRRPTSVPRTAPIESRG